MAKAKSAQSLSYEEALAELESVLDSLEQGDMELEKSLQLFERGKILLSHCRGLLEKAELKVSELSNNDDLITGPEAVE